MACNLKATFGNGEEQSFSLPDGLDVNNLDNILNELPQEELLNLLKGIQRPIKLNNSSVNIINPDTIVGNTTFGDLKSLYNSNPENVQLGLINKIVDSLPEGDLNSHKVLLFDTSIGEADGITFEGKRNFIAANIVNIKDKNYTHLLHELVHYKFNSLLEGNEEFRNELSKIVGTKDIKKLSEYFADSFSLLNSKEHPELFNLFEKYIGLDAVDLKHYTDSKQSYSIPSQYKITNFRNTSGVDNDIINNKISNEFFPKAVSENRNIYYHPIEVLSKAT